MDNRKFFDISIPLKFNGEQPNLYGVEPASAKACEYGDLVGDTRRGGSVNFEEYRIIPHCNGTHTECVGHITDERFSVNDCLQDILIEAVLISVLPEAGVESEDSYPISCTKEDEFITAATISSALKEFEIADNYALVIRTLPNEFTKTRAQYGSAPFFSTEAMELIVGSRFKHLLCDIPSVDRMEDEGQLNNHRIFWNIEFGSKSISNDTRMDSTITELIYVPDEVEDGIYKLNIQIPPFVSDAAPSRPILIRE